MAKVKILVEGYAHTQGDVEHASPNTVLIQDNGKKIIADPGSNKKLLLQALERENIKPEDIDAIFITHFHPDHILNIRQFPDTPIYDIDQVFDDDSIRQHGGKILNTDIEILPTPGHTVNHSSLIVKTDKGIVAVAGDVFWWEDEEDQETNKKDLILHRDLYVKNVHALYSSRKKLIAIADYIIPGHGKTFHVEK